MFLVPFTQIRRWFCNSKIKIESKNLDYLCIKDEWPYSNQDQEEKLKSRISNILQNLKLGIKEHRVLRPFKIKIESQHLKCGWIKEQWPCEIKSKMPNPSQEPQASSKNPNQDLKKMDVKGANFKSGFV